MTDDPIEQRVGAALRERDETLAVAESCTGGLVGSLVTDVSGSSAYFDRSLVTYSYEAKQELLAVSREALDDHGAVSEPVAAEMARGVRDTAGTDWGVATTGVAGPTGGSPETPVGTVYVAVAHAAPWETGESGCTVAGYEFDGARTEVKEKIARQALTDLLGRVQNQ
ncbi:CinA family protein [Haloarcula sediminis]|uniref:CinA family protein n=1 Tax=Haloarcula sediminis TaxID=3111777 RepID=UPI002D77AA01|nr:CinA family protein [Haloarcula sp. CK38]